MLPWAEASLHDERKAMGILSYSAFLIHLLTDHKAHTVCIPAVPSAWNGMLSAATWYLLPVSFQTLLQCPSFREVFLCLPHLKFQHYTPSPVFPILLSCFFFFLALITITLIIHFTCLPTGI